MEYAPASHRVDERQRRLHLGNADAERQLPSPHTAGETDNESARRRPDTRQYVAASPGTGKTHLAIAIARNCIRSGARGRFYNVVDLVNRLEAESRNGRQGRIADYLTRKDFVVLDELPSLNPAASCCST
jgi:chromosomal replication initiation ATPase DnaA